MKREKHTPGPWVDAGCQSNGWRTIYAGQVCVATVWVSSDLSVIDDATCEANARLIAAAPDLKKVNRQLLAACKEFRESVLNGRQQLESPCLDPDQTNAVLSLFDDMVGSAIAAARGEGT